jgi:diguanylate cyclase (GGDEF)-like protein/PAS domain S-box-containing protein
MNVRDIVAEADREAALTLIEKIKHGEIVKSFELRRIAKDGRILDVWLTTTLLTDKNGEPVAIATTERDITERNKAEIALKEKLEAQRRFATVVSDSNDAIILHDFDGKILAWNSGAKETYGYTEAEALGMNVGDIVAEADREEALALIKKIKHGEIVKSFELRRIAKDGRILDVWLTTTLLTDKNGEPVAIATTERDITERKQAREIAIHQANFDPLTELPNRRLFHDRLHQEIKKSKRDGKKLALMFLDLDLFKDINDTLGHGMGDVLLKEVAKRLTQNIRESDTVARMGGDEFTIILGELTDIVSVERVAQSILQGIVEPFKLGNELGYISASIGITIYPDDATEGEELLIKSDQAMYAAKRQGRNRICYFTPSMQETAQARMELTNALRVALAGNQFWVAYQPIVELATGAIHKAEALLRWQHPERGLISPAEFIPLAEETGLINSIGDWVFRQAARQTQIWRADIHPNFQISVNKSPVQFRFVPNLQSTWFEHLQELGLDGQSIVVEITEGLLMDASSSITDQLLAFRDAGIQVSLDDFGTGYSSLSYLKRFDIDYLKIDQSFVKNLTPDSDDMVLCSAIIVMAHALRIQVIAEGVETSEQLDLLTAAGCDYGQGYLWSKPVRPEEFERLLTKS